MQNELAQKITKRLSTLKNGRQPHEDTWKKCFDYSFPIRGRGFNDEIVNAQTVQRKKNILLDTTLTDAARTQASAIMSGLTPANSRWFGLDVDNANDDEKRWLDDAADTIWKNIHNSNFDSAAYEGTLDLMAAGWFVLYVDTDRELGGYSFELWPIASVYCDSTRASGQIDIVYRYYELTAEQIVNEYDTEQKSPLNEQFKDNAKKDPSKPFKVIHAIYPRKDGKQGEQAEKLPIASVHVLEEGNILLRESGYNEMPVVVPRWMQIPQSVYAIGPVSDALPDAETLNSIKRMELANADLAISGMWVAQDDGVLNPRTIQIGPRKVIVANSVDSIKPLQTGSDFNVSFVKSEQLQAAIRKIMLADQLQPQDGPAMTATEVNMRQQLIRQLLGPIYGRMQAEYLQPLVTRCFGIAYRAKILGQPPEELQGKFTSVKYISPLARAQKFEEVTAIQNFVGMTMQSSQAAPTVLDIIDFDAATRFTGEALGVPSEVMRTEKDVADLRQQRAEQQALAQQQAMQQQVEMTAANSAAQAAGQQAGEQAANE